MNIKNFIASRSKITIIIISVLLFIVISIIDHYTSMEVYLFGFYLIPIYIATWFSGKWNGIIFSIISSLVWGGIHILFNQYHYTHPLVPIWNICTLMSLFIIVSLILSRLRNIYTDLDNKIKKGVETIREKEQILIAQSRQAAMGEMIGNIAHQWRQPLNNLGLVIQNYRNAFENGNMNEDYINKSEEKGMRLILHMSHTIDDFRSFFIIEKKGSFAKRVGNSGELARSMIT